MEYHFRYNGPKSETKVRDCALCHTAARGTCVLTEPSSAAGGLPAPHAGAPVVGCAHCDAACNGFCPSHCGIEKALAAHAPHETDPENAEWKEVGIAQTAAGAAGIVRQRFEVPHSDAKQARTEKALSEFEDASSYVLTYCARLPECIVDVSLRADDVDKVGTVALSIHASALPE